MNWGDYEGWTLQMRGTETTSQLVLLPTEKTAGIVFVMGGHKDQLILREGSAQEIMELWDQIVDDPTLLAPLIMEAKL